MGSRPTARASSRPTAGVERWNHLRTQLHGKLVSALTPEQLKNLSKDGVRDQIATVTDRLVQDSGLPMTTAEKDRLIEEVLDEVFGLGPLEPLMQDETVSDIMVNGFDSVYVERGGQMVETNVRFKDQAHVRMTIDRIVSNIGRRIDDHLGEGMWLGEPEPVVVAKRKGHVGALEMLDGGDDVEGEPSRCSCFD